MAEKPFTVFYAWQSDTPARDNRNFIQDAAKAALKKIENSGELEASPRLDSDTKGVPGTPDIVNTILDKIRSSSAFLADLTYVGVSAGDEGEQQKRLPNPNVAIELGYALNQPGSEGIICVMNTHYGDHNDLPFDLRNRRWPIRYHLPPDTSEEERKSIRAALTENLVDAIGAVAKYARSRTSAVTAGDVISRVAGLRDALIERVMRGSFEEMMPVQGMLVLTVAPNTPPSRALPLDKQETQLSSRLSPLRGNDYGWFHRRHGESFVTISPCDRSEPINAVTEITTEGIINAAGHELISLNRNVIEIPSVAFEKSLIEAVQGYLALMAELGIDGPWTVAMALIIRGTSKLLVGQRFLSTGQLFVGDKISPSPCVVPARTDANDFQNIAHALKPAFDFIWREHDYSGSLNYDSDGRWKEH